MDPMVRIALRTARQVGRYIIQTYERPPFARMGQKSLEQFLLQLRSKMFGAYEDAISKAFPDHQVTSDFDSSDFQTGFTWSIDVLNGETNFARSLNDYCTVLGIFQDKELLHSVVYHYIEDTDYFATRELGAIVKQNRLRVSNTHALDQAVIALNDSPGQFSSTELLYTASPLQNSAKVGTILRSGCLGLDMARVSQGKIDGCVVSFDQLTQAKVAGLLVTEAGGFVGMDSNTKSRFVAANPEIFEQLRRQWSKSQTRN